MPLNIYAYIDMSYANGFDFISVFISTRWLVLFSPIRVT